MKEKHLVDEANAVIVQKHQVSTVTNKLNEINNNLDDIKKSQSESDVLLDELMGQMQELLENTSRNNEIDVNLDAVEKELEHEPVYDRVAAIDSLEQIDFNKNMSWLDYLNSVDEYAKKYNLNLSDDPFRNLMSKSQILELQKRIKEDFAYKNANCDKYDYMIAGTCGVIGGIIDVLFVGKPGESDLGDYVDKKANDITMKFAEMLGWDKKAMSDNYLKYYQNKISQNKQILDSYPQDLKDSISGITDINKIKDIVNKYRKENGLNKKIIPSITKIADKNSYLKHRALKFLEGNERNFKGFGINYDQSTRDEVDDLLILTPKNHHLKSLGHAPDIIGLFFSILNQFTNTSSFVDNGRLITIKTETFDLQGSNFIAKIFCGFCNWFGHLMSDWTGSNKSALDGSRGSGIPIPFYELTQLMNFGRFGEKQQETFAVVCSKVFEQGYDLRHGIAMAIPVLITELLIRVMYTLKARFYHEKDWKECIPNANIPELRHMLLVGHGTLCMIDAVDAGIRSGGNMAEFLLRTNLIGWVRFGYLGLKEVNAWYNSDEIDPEKVDEYIEKELYLMVRND